MEVFRFDLPSVHQREDELVHDDRFEHVGQVQIQGEAPVVRGVEVSNPRIEVRSVDLRENGGVEQSVAKAHQRVQLVLRWSATATLESELLDRDDLVEAPVVDFSRVPLDCHQLFDHVAPVQYVEFLGQSLNGFFQRGTIVVFQNADHVLHRALNELAGKMCTLFQIEVEFRLLQHHEAAVEEFSGIVGSDVVAVVVEEMNGDVLLREELQQPLVELHFRKNFYIGDVLNGYVTLPCFGFHHEAVVFAPQRSVGEDVDGFCQVFTPLHDQQRSS